MHRDNGKSMWVGNPQMVWVGNPQVVWAGNPQVDRKKQSNEKLTCLIAEWQSQENISTPA